MNFSFTKNFVREYRKPPGEIQKAVDKQIELLAETRGIRL
jgi:hypothetical protein